MIDFKLFVESIHKAISDAADIMADKNKEFLDQYFSKQKNRDGSECLVPNEVELAIPYSDENGNATRQMVKVPLLTLIPFSSSQIEKATFSADFRLLVEDERLMVAFPDEKVRKGESTLGRLEIVVSPTEPSEGMKAILNAYAETLSKQL